MTGGIWVYVEHDHDQIEDVSLEIISRSSELAAKSNHRVTAIILGDEPYNMPEIVSDHGADSVLFYRSAKLSGFSTDLFTKVLNDETLKRKPEIFLMGATHQGRELAGRLAARLRTGLTANAVSLDLNKEGSLVSGVPGYGSKVVAEIECVKNKPEMSTVRPGIFAKTLHPGKKPNVETVNCDLAAASDRVRVISTELESFKDISKSERTLIAGVGVQDKFELASEIAEAISGDLGVTRPLADRGFAPREVQIGSTGASLKSKVALVIGVSGSEHFVTGIANCKIVISINTDKKADIFDYSDFGVIADSARILPLIAKELGIREVEAQ